MTSGGEWSESGGIGARGAGRGPSGWGSRHVRPGLGHTALHGSNLTTNGKQTRGPKKGPFGSQEFAVTSHRVGVVLFHWSRRETPLCSWLWEKPGLCPGQRGPPFWLPWAIVEKSCLGRHV